MAKFTLTHHDSIRNAINAWALPLGLESAEYTFPWLDGAPTLGGFSLVSDDDPNIITWAYQDEAGNLITFMDNSGAAPVTFYPEAMQVADLEAWMTGNLLDQMDS